MQIYIFSRQTLVSCAAQPVTNHSFPKKVNPRITLGGKIPPAVEKDALETGGEG